MEKIESNLKVEKIFFSELSFNRVEKINSMLEINNSINVKYEEESSNKILVSIVYVGKSNNDLLCVKAIINGRFELTNYENLDAESINSLLKINTISILFPYLRSQIVLLTSQVGLNPIQLPIINAELLYKSSLSN